MGNDGEALEEMAAAVEHLNRAAQKVESEELDTVVKTALDDLDDHLLQAVETVGEIHEDNS
jgi:histidinol dehydrogenase